jgi:hypothetical protein
MVGAGKMASPSTWMPGVLVDSMLSQLMSTQRLLISLMPDLCAMSPARWGG